jgi:hypothetical protein
MIKYSQRITQVVSSIDILKDNPHNGLLKENTQNNPHNGLLTKLV